MIILCADDYGLSESVSCGIAELCDAGRLSATSAIVTFDRWPVDAERLRELRGVAAIGLHLNLTLGGPLIAAVGARHLDRDGGFLPIGKLTQRALLGAMYDGVMRQHPDLADLRRECHAQIETFRDAVGALPDFIDGHQHVHGLPVIRDALIEAMSDFAWQRPPLVRVPSNVGARLGGPRNEWVKRRAIAELTRGLRNKLRSANLPTNDTFAGFSSFKVGSDYGVELDAALGDGGRCHLVMCHPGYVDEELRLCDDPVVERRAEELQSIMTFEELPERIWRPERGADGCIDWTKAMTG